MSIIREFKDFIARGSVVDLSVGIIVGSAFGKIINSFVVDVLMPPLGLLLGKVDFTNLFISLNGVSYNTLDEAKAAGAPTLNYGLFIDNVVDFLIVAFVIYLIVRQMAKFMAKPHAMVDCPRCLSKIPDAATKCPYCTIDIESIKRR